jgi:hypothetical protein
LVPPAVTQNPLVLPLSSIPVTYLNLHLGDSETILAHGMPTLNFRPELCANVTSVRLAGHR